MASKLVATLLYTGESQCRFPASTNPDIYAAQRTLLEAWSIVSENFVDQSFAGHNWEEELKDSLTNAYPPPPPTLLHPYPQHPNPPWISISKHVTPSDCAIRTLTA